MDKKEGHMRITMSDYTPFEKLLLEVSRLQRWDGKKWLEQDKITLETIVEKLRESGVKEELLQKAIEQGMEDGSASIAYKSDAFERHVLAIPEFREFRRNVQPFLTADQNKRIIEALAPMLYAKLSDRARQELTERMIVMKSLNLGYIRLPRASHRLACNFIVQYPALFRHETEVLDGMVERLVDEELSTTPIGETREKVTALKNDLRKIYASVGQ